MAVFEEPGCYLEGHRGWRISGDVILLAAEHGFPLSDKDATLVHRWLDGEPYPSDEFDPMGTIVSLCDDAERWMNDNLAPEGHSFGFYEGEFFLWPDKEWETI